MKSGCPASSALTTTSVTGTADISGARSYVATARFDGTRLRSSPGYSFSTPPLKKYVTWGNFSVSAVRSSGRPALAAREHLPGDLEAVPPLVAIHGVVAPHGRRELAHADLLQFGGDGPQGAGGRARRRVAPVEERVPGHLGEAAPLRELAHRV